jgi:hypothetical protein
VIWFDTLATLVERSGELDMIVVVGTAKVMGVAIDPPCNIATSCVDPLWTTVDVWIEGWGMALSAETAELAAELTEVTPDPVLVVELLPDVELLPVKLFPDSEPVLVVRLLLDVELLLNVALLPTVEPVPFPDAWLEEAMLVVLMLLVLEMAELWILETAVVFKKLGETAKPTVL